MKIPENAKRVFKGIIYDVYHWEQEMFDGSYETFEALRRTPTIQIIASQGDEILLADEEQPGSGRFMGFFGGRLEEGESPLNCAKRELLEETGLESDNWELIEEYESPNTKIEWTTYFFAAANCKKTAEPKLDPGEKIEVKKASFEEFLELIQRNNLRAKLIVEDILGWDEKKLDEFRNKLLK